MIEEKAKYALLKLSKIESNIVGIEDELTKLLENEKRITNYLV